MRDVRDRVDGRSTNDVVVTIIFESVSRRAFDQHAVAAMLWLEIRTTPSGVGVPLPGRNGAPRSASAISLTNQLAWAGSALGHPRSCRGQGELVFVEVEMFSGVAVDLFEGHVVLEEGIPAGGEMHAAVERVLGFTD